MDTKRGKQQGRGCGGVMYCVIGIDMYTLMCIKLVTNENLLYEKKNKLIYKKRLNKKTFFSDSLFKNVSITQALGLG